MFNIFFVCSCWFQYWIPHKGMSAWSELHCWDLKKVLCRMQCRWSVVTGLKLSPSTPLFTVPLQSTSMRSVLLPGFCQHFWWEGCTVRVCLFLDLENVVRGWKRCKHFWLKKFKTPLNRNQSELRFVCKLNDGFLQHDWDPTHWYCNERFLRKTLIMLL